MYLIRARAAITLARDKQPKLHVAASKVCHMVAHPAWWKTNVKIQSILSKLPRYIAVVEPSTAQLLMMSNANYTFRLLLHAFIILPLRSTDRRTREDRASSREAAFLLVTFCCDRHSITKCLQQIKRFAISRPIHFLNIYTDIIKRVSTFTRKAHAAVFGASSGGEDDQ